jgi:hypothetical protein
MGDASPVREHFLGEDDQRQQQHPGQTHDPGGDQNGEERPAAAQTVKSVVAGMAAISSMAFDEFSCMGLCTTPSMCPAIDCAWMMVKAHAPIVSNRRVTNSAPCPR